MAINECSLSNEYLSTTNFNSQLESYFKQSAELDNHSYLCCRSSDLSMASEVQEAPSSSMDELLIKDDDDDNEVMMTGDDEVMITGNVPMDTMQDDDEDDDEDQEDSQWFSNTLDGTGAETRLI